MTKPLLQVDSFHGYTIEELVALENETTCKFTRIGLAFVTMRYRGYSNQ